MYEQSKTIQDVRHVLSHSSIIICGVRNRRIMLKVILVHSGNPQVGES